MKKGLMPKKKGAIGIMSSFSSNKKLKIFDDRGGKADNHIILRTLHDLNVLNGKKEKSPIRNQLRTFAFPIYGSSNDDQYTD